MWNRGKTKFPAESKDAEVVGIEPNQSRAASGKEAGIEVYNEYLSPSLAGRMGIFDVVVFADVLEHGGFPMITDGLVVRTMPGATPGQSFHIAELD